MLTPLGAEDFGLCSGGLATVCIFCWFFHTALASSATLHLAISAKAQTECNSHDATVSDIRYQAGERRGICLVEFFLLSGTGNPHHDSTPATGRNPRVLTLTKQIKLVQLVQANIELGQLCKERLE